MFALRFSLTTQAVAMSEVLPVVLHSSIPLLAKRFSIWSQNFAQCAGLQMVKVRQRRVTLYSPLHLHLLACGTSAAGWTR